MTGAHRWWSVPGIEVFLTLNNQANVSVAAGAHFLEVRISQSLELSAAPFPS